MIGPKGLPLPVWKPEYLQEARKASTDRARLLAESSTTGETWEDTHDYGSEEYWVSRYAAGVEHEWYCPPKVLVQLLPSPPGHLNAAERMAAELAGRRPTRPIARALVLGNCREELPRLLLEKGFAHVLSVDVVEAAMAELTERVTVTNPALQFRVMDAADLHPLDDQSFDLVVDKGVLDALMCSQEPFAKVGAAVSEVHRVTKVGGTFVSISHSNDRHSGGHLSPVGMAEWEIKSSRCLYDMEKSGDPQADGIVFYKYVCTKRQEL